MSTAASWKNRQTVKPVYASFSFGKSTPTKHSGHDFHLCLPVISTPAQNCSWHKSAWLQWHNTKLQQVRIWPHRNILCPFCGILLVLKSILHLSSVPYTIPLLPLLCCFEPAGCSCIMQLRYTFICQKALIFLSSSPKAFICSMSHLIFLKFLPMSKLVPLEVVEVWDLTMLYSLADTSPFPHTQCLISNSCLSIPVSYPVSLFQQAKSNAVTYLCHLFCTNQKGDKHRIHTAIK